MKINRIFVNKSSSAYDLIQFDTRSSVIRNPDGSIVFEMNDIKVPNHWSQVATDIIAQKYFRKAGIPVFIKKVEEDGVPEWLQRSEPDNEKLKDIVEEERFTSETDSRQVFTRLAGCWTYWGWKHNYFKSEEDAKNFFEELTYMLAMQLAAPNSPQWFNTGLNWAYGISGPSQGHFYIDPETEKLVTSKDAYTHPQPHACARGNTKIFTDKGIYTIEEIVEKNLTDLKVFDGQEFVNLIAVKNNGVKSVYRTKFKNGNFIEFTDDHLIYSSDKRLREGGHYEWNEMKTLLGKKVQQYSMKQDLIKEELFEEVFSEANSNGKAFKKTLSDLGIETESELAEEDKIKLDKAALAGWIIGDGYYGKYNRNQKTTLFGAITINDDEYSYVTELFENIFGTYKTVVRKNINDLYRIVKNDSKNVDEFVNEYELDVRSFTAKVPEVIFKSSNNEKIYFLKSLFQTDGCVRNQGRRRQKFRRYCFEYNFRRACTGRSDLVVKSWNLF